MITPSSTTHWLYSPDNVQQLTRNRTQSATTTAWTKTIKIQQHHKAQEIATTDHTPEHAKRLGYPSESKQQATNIGKTTRMTHKLKHSLQLKQQETPNIAHTQQFLTIRSNTEQFNLAFYQTELVLPDIPRESLHPVE